MWATHDVEFGAAQCQVWNDWTWETFGPYNDFMSPIAAIMTADVDVAIEEIKRVARLGFRGVNLPCKPIWGAHDARHPNYNLPLYDPMWAVIQDCDLPITFHISTGMDPRAARKDGGAVINYVTHACTTVIEPMSCLCASGVLARFPGLRFALIECGIGWLPWALDAMDEAYRKHHLWAYPKLKQLPSEYFRQHGAASFQEDASGLRLAEPYDLVDNLLWANDYPHAEGSWPHSAEAVERQMQNLRDQSRAKILGLNTAKIFNFDVERLLCRRHTGARPN
jgi:predicted TIM-barrel fold metal-dependent hydrolase